MKKTNKNQLTPKNILIDHLESSIKKDIYPLVYSVTPDRDAGFFASLLLMLCQIDFLGALYTGEVKENTSYNAVSFMRVYMGKVDDTYKKCSGLVYHIWRHGTVHQKNPKTIKMSEDLYTTWGVVKGEGNGAAIKVIKCNLIININKFYKDLILAINLFLEDVEKSDVLRHRFEKAWLSMQEAEDWKKLTKKRKYLSEDDPEFIFGASD